MNKITIIVSDKTVVVDGNGVVMPDLDWSHPSFTGEPDDLFDDVAAVQFSFELGQGHLEYKWMPTKQAGRPNVRPPNYRIGQAEFEAMFGWVLPEYQKAFADAEQKRAEFQAAVDAERAAAKEAAAAAQDSGTAQEIEALKAQNKELSDKLAGLDDALKAIYEAQVRVAKGDE